MFRLPEAGRIDIERHDTFGEWLRQRRRAFDLTQADLAERVGCSVSGLRKIESDERRPSRQIAELLARHLQISPDECPVFVKVARGVERVERLGAPGPVSVAGWLGPTPLRPGSNLPTPPTPLVGREPELAALTGLLCDPRCRLLTVLGPGGIGKTRLAIEAASTQRERFSDGAYFVPLVSLTSPQFIVPAIADALGLVFSGPADPKAQLLNHLREKSSLLVLDSLEHLLEGAGLLAELLQQAPGVKLLVTSRERLNLQAEWLFGLQGLPVPSLDQVDQAEEYSAVALFLQSAGRAQVGFELRPEERPWVVHICRLVEGMPLAIELAAAWVRLLSCQEIAQEIERNLDFLCTSARDMPERHRSMRAVFDQSWQMLSAEEQQVLGRLSVFRGGFRRHAAEQVAQVSLSLLTALVDKSLLRRNEAGRYGLHPLIRQYAADCLREDPDHDRAARDRHSHYYLTMVREREAILHSHRRKEVIGELTVEIDNLRLAWEWAATRGQVTLLRQTAWPLWLYYSMRNLLQEGEAMLLRAVEGVKRLDVNDELGDAARQAGVDHWDEDEFY